MYPQYLSFIIHVLADVKYYGIGPYRIFSIIKVEWHMYQLFVYCYDRTPRRKATQESLLRLMVPEGESVHDGGAKAWPQTTSMTAGKDDRELTSGIKSKRPCF